MTADRCILHLCRNEMLSYQFLLTPLFYKYCVCVYVYLATCSDRLVLIRPCGCCACTGRAVCIVVNVESPDLRVNFLKVYYLPAAAALLRRDTLLFFVEKPLAVMS